MRPDSPRATGATRWRSRWPATGPGGCADAEASAPMLKWLLVVSLALVLFSGLMPVLRRLGIGRLPGDLNFRLFGRDWSIPLTSTILLSLAAAAIARLI